MTRDESIELASHLHRVLSGGIVVAATAKDTNYAQVTFENTTLPDQYMVDQIATERSLLVSWEYQNGEQVATFRSRPTRNSFVYLTQEELETCFGIAFGPKRLFKACRNGGVRAMHNQNPSPEVERWTHMQATIDEYVLTLVIWYGSGVEVRMEINDDIIPGVADLARLFEHLKLINVDFGF